MSALERPNAVLVTSETMLPDLIRAHPATRHVLDRYGLRGCGGEHGPVESVQFFARAHGVAEAQLLAELRDAVANPTSVQPALPEADAALADSLYRPFFLAGMAVVLTAGATWGMLLLWRIGLQRNFTGLSVHEVNAHGHAQIFGWVGLFIMGFAYQAFPRIWHTSIQRPRVALGVLAAMVLGVVIRSVGMAAGPERALALPLALGGGLLELAAVVVFVAQILGTAWRARVPVEPYLAFIVAALGWFVAMAALSLAHTWNTMTAADSAQLVWFVATWQAPLRDLQIHGLALFMICGVSLRMLPGLFGLDDVPARRAWWAFGLLLAGVIGEVSLFLAYRLTGTLGWAVALPVAWLLLATGCGLVALPWRLWRPFPDGDRSEKFIRTAWGWLAISLALLLAFPLYQRLTGTPFSHAYYGAIRHAITVGFVSLMILGFAAKVVPTLNGLDTRRLSALWGPFVLVNLGCALRVTTQVLTDFVPGAFAIIGVSGTLEVLGLAWWCTHLVGIFLAARRGAVEQDNAPISLSSAPPPRRLTSDALVAAVLTWFPATEAVFLRHGFTPLLNPVMRRTIARRTSLAQAARLRGVALDCLLADLTEAAYGRGCPAPLAAEP